MTAEASELWKPAPAMPTDEPAVRRLFAECSMSTITQRFFAPVREFPRAYLEGALAGSPATHDAVVVRYGDGLHVAALASFVRSCSDPLAGELGVLVGDAWQRRGLGDAMVQLLVARAVGRGCERMTASVLPHRGVLLDVLSRYGFRASVELTPDFLTGHFVLPSEVPTEARPWPPAGGISRRVPSSQKHSRTAQQQL